MATSGLESTYRCERATEYKPLKVRHYSPDSSDAVYLDLASRRGLALASRDRALRRAAEAMGVALIEA